MYPEDLRYTPTHEWVRVAGDTATIGISAHAVEELGDIVNVDLPLVGAAAVAGEAIGSVDSVKAVADVVSPVSGEVVNVNSSLVDAPELAKDDPYGSGWMIAIKMDDPSQLDSLMTSEQYERILKH